MSDLPDMHMKIGKHSVWVWGAVLGGVVFVYVWHSRRSASQAAANAPSTTDTVDPTADPNAALGGYPATSGTGLTPAPVPVGTTDTTGAVVDPTTGLPADPTVSDYAPPPDNQSWESKAVAYLSGHGVSPVNAQIAIEHYLNGDRLSYQQATWMNGAIGGVGLAPEGTLGIPSYSAKPKPKPKPEPKAKPKPSVHHPATHHAESHSHEAHHHAAPHHATSHHAAPQHKPAPKKAKVVIKKRHK